MNRSINYPIAKDSHGNWIHIDSLKEKPNEPVYCPECNSQFTIRLGEFRKHHFAHKSGTVGICSGESGYHAKAKHLLAYHFERIGQISIDSSCPHCEVENQHIHNISKVEVEKGDNEHRPDVRLSLQNGEIIECEIVYRNPLGEKLKKYHEARTNAIVWYISGNVENIPNIVQRNWGQVTTEADLKKDRLDSLLLLLSREPINHKCEPSGMAYVGVHRCNRCGDEAPVAIFSRWFPFWTDLSQIGCEYIFDAPTHSHVSSKNIPSCFWQGLNKEFGCHLRNDFSISPLGFKFLYIMNHCHCGWRIPDICIKESIMNHKVDPAKFKLVKIKFQLTQLELQAFKQSPWAGYFV